LLLLIRIAWSGVKVEVGTFKKDLELHIKSNDAAFFWLQMGLKFLLLARRG